MKLEWSKISMSWLILNTYQRILIRYKRIGVNFFSISPKIRKSAEIQSDTSVYIEISRLSLEVTFPTIL